MPLSQLSYGLIVFTGVWDWSLQRREQRRGFYSKREEDMVMVAQALTRGGRMDPTAPGAFQKSSTDRRLIAPKEIEFAVPDRSGARDTFFGMLQ